MTMTEIKPKGSSKTTAIKFSQVTLMYVQLKKARPVFAQKDLPPSQQTMFEYSVDIVVDEDTSDAWNALFPKQSAKKMLKKDFMKSYKIEKDEDFPAGLDSESKKFYIIKIKQNTHYEDGKTKKVKPLGKELRPRLVYLSEGKKVDGTLTVEVGNGSIGDVLVSINHNKTYGDSGKLKAVLVTELVEYSSGGSKVALDDFFGEDVELVELPDEPEVTNGSQSDEDDSDIDIPDDLPEEDEAPFDLDEEDY